MLNRSSANESFEEEELHTLFPHINIVNKLNQMTVAFEKNLFKSSADYQTYTEDVKNEVKSEIGLFERLFGVLNGKIEEGLSQMQATINQRKKVDVSPLLHQESPELKIQKEVKKEKEVKKAQKKPRKIRLEQEKSPHQSEIQPLNEGILLKKKNFSQSKQIDEEIYCCLKCFLHHKIKDHPAEKILSFIYSKPEEYIDHLLKEHQFLPFAYLSTSQLKYCSHVTLMNELKSQVSNFLKLFLDIAMVIKQKRCNGLFICGCQNTIIQSTKYSKFFIQFKEDQFFEHIIYLHKGKSQANSSHFLTQKNGYKRLQRFLDLKDSFYQSNMIKFFEAVQLRIGNSYLNGYPLHFQERLLVKNEKLSNLELLARAPRKIKLEILKPVVKLFVCLVCKKQEKTLISLNDHYATQHQIRSESLKSLYSSQFSSEFIQNHVIPAKQYNHIQKKNATNIKLKLAVFMLEKFSIFKCGFCHDQSGYFTDLSNFLYHLELNHDSVSENSSHLLKKMKDSAVDQAQID